MPNKNTIVTRKDIIEAINKLGINDKPLCIHSSLKSFGYIEGGAKTLIQAFQDSRCTVLVPAFTYVFETYPPMHLRPKRNGAGDYSYFENKIYSESRIFTIDCNDIDKEDMGAIPYAIVNMPSRQRGYNPLNSFVAVGQHAEELVKNQSAMDVYAPLCELCKQDGWVLLMGVNLDRATILHYAEQLAGRKPFIRWAKDINGKAIAVSSGSCSDGFNAFSDILRPIEKTATVGESYWRCFPAKEMVNICSKVIRAEPSITHCNNPDCERCNDAILGGPIW